MWECRWSLALFWQGQQVVYHPSRYEALPLGRVCSPQAQRRCHWLFWPPVPRNWRVTGANYKRFPNRRRQGRAASLRYQRRIEQGWCRRSRDGRLRSTRNHGNTNRRISAKEDERQPVEVWVWLFPINAGGLNQLSTTLYMLCIFVDSDTYLTILPWLPTTQFTVSQRFLAMETNNPEYIQLLSCFLTATKTVDVQHSIQGL